MVWSLPPRSRNSLSSTLGYFAKYNYPLTPDELWFWQQHTRISKFKIRNLLVQRTYSNFKFQISNWKLRKKRELISRAKWLIAKRVGDRLSKNPFIQAIFVTGSLAMSNCTPDADIDLMIITSPNALWLTRLFVYLGIRSFRRKPQTNSAPNLVCDNLYLDTKNLKLKNKNLFVAHELLQAKCIFDRGNIQYRLLTQNSWVGDYLPIAYRETLKDLKFRNLNLIENFKLKIVNLLAPLNITAFALQYLYMLPKITSERIGPGFAFFHPRVNISQSNGQKEN